MYTKRNHLYQQSYATSLKILTNNSQLFQNTSNLVKKSLAFSVIYLLIYLYTKLTVACSGATN